jgi:hypothetical protein
MPCIQGSVMCSWLHDTLAVGAVLALQSAVALPTVQGRLRKVSDFALLVDGCCSFVA